MLIIYNVLSFLATNIDKKMPCGFMKRIYRLNRRLMTKNACKMNRLWYTEAHADGGASLPAARIVCITQFRGRRAIV